MNERKSHVLVTDGYHGRPLCGAHYEYGFIGLWQRNFGQVPEARRCKACVRAIAESPTGDSK